jgi:hypothetical protein
MYYVKPLNSYFEIGKDVVLNELFGRELANNSCDPGMRKV